MSKEIKTNSSQLNEEFDKFAHLRKITCDRVGGEARFGEIKSEILAIRGKYNLTPTVLKDIVIYSLMEDELLHTLKKC